MRAEPGGVVGRDAADEARRPQVAAPGSEKNLPVQDRELLDTKQERSCSRGRQRAPCQAPPSDRRAFVFSHGGGTMPFLIERFLGLPRVDKRYAHLTAEQILASLSSFHYDTAAVAHSAPLSA